RPAVDHENDYVGRRRSLESLGHHPFAKSLALAQLQAAAVGHGEAALLMRGRHHVQIARGPRNRTDDRSATARYTIEKRRFTGISAAYQTDQREPRASARQIGITFDREFRSHWNNCIRFPTMAHWLHRETCAVSKGSSDIQKGSALSKAHHVEKCTTTQ